MASSAADAAEPHAVETKADAAAPKGPRSLASLLKSRAVAAPGGEDAGSEHGAEHVPATTDPADRLIKPPGEAKRSPEQHGRRPSSGDGLVTLCLSGIVVYNVPVTDVSSGTNMEEDLKSADP